MKVGGWVRGRVVIECIAEMDTEGDVKTKEEDETLDEMNHDNELSRNGRDNNVKNQSFKDCLEDDLTKSKDQEMDESEKADVDEPHLFRLTVVNSYGSQEVQKLEVSKTYKFSSACFWVGHLDIV